MKYLRMAQKGFSYGESSGGASIYDPVSGTLSKDDGFINIKKYFFFKFFYIYDNKKNYLFLRALEEKNLSMHSKDELEVFK